MSPTETHDAIIHRLVAPKRYACAMVGTALALSLVCCAHALISEPGDRLDSAHSLVQRLLLSDIAIVPDEELRHPGWGRPEQGRAGQPGLPNPHAGTTFVHPLPMKVSK